MSLISLSFQTLSEFFILVAVSFTLALTEKCHNDFCWFIDKPECSITTLKARNSILHVKWASYHGHKSTTVSGCKCAKWKDVHNPYLKEEHNYCRNPISASADTPWCFTDNPAVPWEYCFDQPSQGCTKRLSKQEAFEQAALAAYNEYKQKMTRCYRPRGFSPWLPSLCKKSDHSPDLNKHLARVLTKEKLVVYEQCRSDSFLKKVNERR